MSLRSLGIGAERAADELLEIVFGGVRDRVPLSLGGLLDPIARLIGSDIIGWHEVPVGGGSVRTELWPDQALQPLAEQRMREYQTTHPLLEHYTTTKTLDVLDPRDVCSVNEWRRSSAYRVIKVEFGVTQQLAIPISVGDGVFGAYALGRQGRAYRNGERLAASWVQRVLRSAQAQRARRLPRSPSIRTLDSRGESTLTEREVAVLSALASGRTRAATARLLQMSPRTLDKHVEHIYAKLGVHSLIEALAVIPVRSFEVSGNLTN